MSINPKTLVPIVILMVFIIVVSVNTFVQDDTTQIDDTVQPAVGYESNSGIVVTIRQLGGSCGQTLCTSVTSIYRDGAYTFVDATEHEIYGEPTTERKRLTEAVIQHIAVTDFDALYDTLYTGICPTDNGGQEILYTFVDENLVKHSLSTCEVHLGQEMPLMQIVDELWDTLR